MKTEEQIDSDRKEAVTAMRAAQKHMSQALDRISDLEKALKQAASDLENVKRYIARDSYIYNTTKRAHDLIDENISAARSKL